MLLLSSSRFHSTSLLATAGDFSTDLFSVPPSSGGSLFLLVGFVAVFRERKVFTCLIVSLNTARDLGGRLAAITIWGTQGTAFIRVHFRIYNLVLAAGGNYAMIAALLNIPAMLFGAFLYEIFLTDSDRGVYPYGFSSNQVTFAYSRRPRPPRGDQASFQSSSDCTQRSAGTRRFHGKNLEQCFLASLDIFYFGFLYIYYYFVLL